MIPFGLAAASSPRITAMTNAFVAVLVFGAAVLVLFMFGYYVVLDVRARRRERLRMRILEAVKDEAAGREKVAVSDKKDLFNRRGLAVVTEVFTELDDDGRTALRRILQRMGLGSLILRELKTDNEDYLVELVRLVGEMDLVGLDTRVTALLYAYKNNIDLQYESFLALSKLGSFEPLVRVCLDENYVHTLSFRSLQQILTAFNGDKAKLYETLLAAPDHYVVRTCLKRIGAEGFAQLAPEVELWLDNPDHNLVIDAVRALGQLHYQPAAGKIASLLSHARWEVRSIAATALAAIDRDAYEDALIKALQDSEWQVRYNAGAALRTSPHMESIRQKVEKTQDRYALEMLQFMIETEEIWRQAQ